MQKAKLLEWHSKGLNAVFSKCLEQKGCPGQQAENKNSAHTLLLHGLYPTLQQWMVNKMDNSNSCQHSHLRNTAACSSPSVIVHYLYLMQTFVTVTLHFRKIATICKILWELQFTMFLKRDQNYGTEILPSRASKRNTSLRCRVEEYAQGTWNGSPLPFFFPKPLLLVTAKDRALDQTMV